MFVQSSNRLRSVSPRVAAMSVVLALSLLPFGAPALAAPASVGQPVPFKGTWQATEISVGFVPPNLHNVATVSGNATHLGQYTANFEAFINVADYPLIGVVSIEFVAANGDKLFCEGTGIGTNGDVPGTFNIVEHYTITGGTGRFGGATGSFTTNRVIANNVTTGTIDGTIVLSH